MTSCITAAAPTDQDQQQTQGTTTASDVESPAEDNSGPHVLRQAQLLERHIDLTQLRAEVEALKAEAAQASAQVLHILLVASNPLPR